MVCLQRKLKSYSFVLLVLLEGKSSIHDGSKSASPDTEPVCGEERLSSPQLDEQTLESPETLSDTKGSLLEEQRRIEEELVSLSTPCKLGFSVCIKFQEAVVVGRARKKVKMSQGRPLVKGKGLVCLELTWLSGDTDSKDMLHQLLQYLKNKLDRLL